MKKEYLSPRVNVNDINECAIAIMASTVPHNPSEAPFEPVGSAPARNLYI